MAHPLVQKTEEDFKKTLEHLNDEFAKLQTGRASASLVEHVMVEAYGSSQPIKNLAGVSIPDSRTIQIQPWDKGLLHAIEKAIQISDININPVNNGLSIILNVPPLTEERRRDLCKVVSRLAEEAKIALRNLRHDAMAMFKRMEASGDMTEDDQKGAEKALQDAVDEANKQVEEMAKKKEEVIMTV
ncbi:MAG: ribosome recycling factor [Candidatus Gracilibacteria bacterium]|jgi:ribosome recycling factor